MSASKPGLPDFASPPVVEVVLGVQFEPLPAMKAPHLGLLWNEWRGDFPRVEDRAPLDPVVELFGLPPVRDVEVRVEVVDSPPVRRSWFLNTTGSELIQAQPDRLIHNWRRIGADEPYPRYWKVRETFRQELETFVGFVEREQLGQVAANQCEVTYVNDIAPGPGWDRPGQLERVFTVWTARYGDDFLPEPESARFAVQFVLPDDQGSPLGRLHVNASPATRQADGQPIVRLVLTARGSPEGEDMDGVFRFLDRGHDWAVRAFASITTPAMHRIWGRHDGH
jgi:uncharacterized protein (TIGR04255 family)